MKQETNFGIFLTNLEGGKEKKALLEIVLYGVVYPGSTGVPWPEKYSDDGTVLLIICPISANHTLSHAVGKSTENTVQVQK